MAASQASSLAKRRIAIIASSMTPLGRQASVSGAARAEAKLTPKPCSHINPRYAFGQGAANLVIYSTKQVGHFGYRGPPSPNMVATEPARTAGSSVTSTII
jgi:hypothetical protein